MGYRKDSRMGDDVFATGAAIAPFIIILVRKIMTKVTKQQQIDPSLPEDQKRRLLKHNLTNKVHFWRSVGIVCLVLEVCTFFIGRASIGDVTWFLIIGYFYLSHKKKLEAL